MASFEAAAEEWDAVAEVEPTFGEGKKEKVAVVAGPIVTMEKILDHLQETWIEDYLAQVEWPPPLPELTIVPTQISSRLSCISNVRPLRPNQGTAARLLACLPQKVGS